MADVQPIVGRETELSEPSRLVASPEGRALPAETGLPFGLHQVFDTAPPSSATASATRCRRPSPTICTHA
ncbi:hypothetical protein [Streptomyces sp. NPDC001530]|uniref:hypothetical protein n=1 Tax=Streptomyces sp. NPDC001530 TaxID=3364582 RepID=UPI0036A5FA0D